ncbi:VCBS repeat-containing protein [Clostridium swellfunianum]|uniref:VCBS repeat-containing protein n=1 Tax=Clostridium swellfunianum TaxID=1367462 RepID=UPI00202F626B|nr:VCBS repeat-containing protein [Clostridium swellfunianum]MCM0650641.1 VCBS repeat-containing protein [Clostridium swellfunianum]
MYINYFREDKVRPQVVAYARGDVNGDKITDIVYLVGTKTPDSPFVQNITLIIKDGMTGRIAAIVLKENAGYDPTLFLGDFTGDGVKDILISIVTGGSGATMYHYIYSYVDNNSKLIFDFEVYNEEYKYLVAYKDNYKVQVVSEKNNKEYIIDISQRDKDYLNEIYDENGQLKEPLEGFVNPLSGLYPVDFDYNGVYQLLAYQKVAGRFNADALGFILNTLQWQNNNFELENQNIAIIGAGK